MSRGIHTKPNQGETTTWLTPPHITEALGTFDLDPCGYPGWKTAKKLICLPEDGLAADWEGRVFINPPYSAKGNEIWLRKLASHGNGIALVAARTETVWFHEYVWKIATGALFLKGRLRYHRPDGVVAKGNAGHGSVLVAYGYRNKEILLRSGIKGKFIPITTNYPDYY